MIKNIKEEIPVNTQSSLLQVIQYSDKYSTKLFSLITSLYDETDYFLYEKKDLPNNITEFEKNVRQLIEMGSAIFISKINGLEVGFIAICREKADKKNHVARIILGILKKWWGNGIGTLLLSKIDEWVLSTRGIKRLELTVRTDNYQAIKLYIDNGFKFEGIKENSFRINNNYKNEYMMSKIYNI